MVVVEFLTIPLQSGGRRFHCLAHQVVEADRVALSRRS